MIRTPPKTNSQYLHFTPLPNRSLTVIDLLLHCYMMLKVNLIIYITFYNKLKKSSQKQTSYLVYMFIFSFHKSIFLFNFFYYYYSHIQCTLMSCRKILPPLWFWTFISFSACSRSSCDCLRKNLAKLCRAWSSLSK